MWPINWPKSSSDNLGELLAEVMAYCQPGERVIISVRKADQHG
jgi:hypothetical protein